MHRIREVLSVTCLCHWRPYIVVLSTSWPLDAIALRTNTGHSIDRCVCTRNWLLAWTAVINSIRTISLFRVVLYRWRSVHAHDVTQVRHVWRPLVVIITSYVVLSACNHRIIRVVGVWHTLVWATCVTWMVWMAWGDHIVVLLRHVLWVV